ncbi:hypothetical protein IT072_08765 [Leifsonia sp. ZF2019]|uniref:hypothetical protein n=1 Tax=Leifsonia sp. ZF2019 TaxID=2781978 RepID=UPI001CBB7F8D|nr:hypothetical protein [Leifsonia sp. ZF2019]UAJ81060.1 hypothetical protein IT072_08765 [Leifsonia sp. ZF2019]
MTELGARLAVPRTDAPVGVARRDITPPTGIRAKNWGPADWERSEGAHRPFTATALAVGADPLVLVALDGTWWRRVDDERAVRGRVRELLGIAEERLVIALSHTHAGAVLCSADAGLPGGELIPGYLDALAEAIASAAREAVDTAAPGHIDWTAGRCALAADRELDIEGRALVGYNPDATEADDTVVVGRITAADGGTVGTVVNYACHPTTLAWQNRLVSPDYVGAMRELVEAETGAPVLFLQGASGELAPRRQYTGELDVADRHGRALGYAVLSALALLPAPGTELELSGVVESGAPLGMWTEAPQAPATTIAAARSAVELELNDLPTLDDLERSWADIDPRSRQERLGRARNLRDGYIDGPTVEHPLWAWRLGDALLVAHPGEAYSAFQTGVRGDLEGNPVLVLNLANGPGFVYLPTDEAYRRGAYQAWQTPLAPGSLGRVTAAASGLLCDLLDGGAR